MEKKICPQCNREMEHDAQFCPGCGSKSVLPVEITCSACSKANASDACFCKYCGEKIVSQKNLVAVESALSQTVATAVQQNVGAVSKVKEWVQSSKYGKIAILFAIVLVLSAISSYMYFNVLNENKYLGNYAEASRKIAAANDALTNNITPENLKNTKATEIQQIIQQQKNDIDALAKELENQKGPSKYIEQHKNVIKLLQLDNSILQQSLLVLNNPLNAETDNLLSVIKGNIDDAKAVAAQIQLPNTTFTISSDMLMLSHQLTIYVEEKRKANKDKMDRLNALNEFFKNVDGILQRYNGAKDDLGGLLENIRNGGYTWNDYFRTLNQAKFSRIDMRTQVDKLAAPKGAEDLKRQFSEVLTKSIRYCEMMNAAANVEFSSNLRVAQPKYNEAKKVNDSVQEAYQSFINNYQTEKTKLTMMDNL